ncbi:hypothetical protein [Oscillatoria acuminata]|uniref:hypothetical protein n=1 Tax=Oscillatoria acuminata TaxID=118323 RepID=UPI0012E99E75|nr:hypothetical protein [Oscillatoria acuminata]
MHETSTLGQTVKSNRWNAIPHLSCLMLFHGADWIEQVRRGDRHFRGTVQH